jgi:hypothetical protein
MKMMALTILALMVLPLIAAPTDFGYNNLNKPTLSKTVINYTTKNVNSSEYWDNLDTPLDITAMDTFTVNNITLDDTSGNNKGAIYWNDGVRRAGQGQGIIYDAMGNNEGHLFWGGPLKIRWSDGTKWAHQFSNTGTADHAGSILIASKLTFENQGEFNSWRKVNCRKSNNNA